MYYSLFIPSPIKENLVSRFGDYKLSYYKPLCAGICVGMTFEVLWVNSKVADSYSKNTYGFVRLCHPVFHSGRAILHFYQ